MAASYRGYRTSACPSAWSAPLWTWSWRSQCRVSGWFCRCPIRAA